MLTIKNRLRNRMLLVLTLAALFGGCSPPGPRALLRGKKLMDQGHFPEAVEELKTAASLLSTNAQAWNYLGLACHYAGQITNAVADYQHALALDHDLVEAHYNLGCLWLEQGRLEPAKSELTTYTSLRRGSADGWLKLGIAQLRISRQGGAPRATELATAEQSFSQALRLASQNPEAFNGLGLIQLQRNRPREAALYFSHALKQQPDYAPALLNLAVVSQVYLNNPPLALQKYREYLALPNRAGREESVQAAVRQLELELNPPRAAAQTVSTPPRAHANPPAIASTTPARAENSSGTAPATNEAKSAPRVAPQNQNVEVTRLSSEPEPKPARDITSSSQSSSTSQTKSTAISSKKEKAEKRGFLSRINPLNVLHRSSSTNHTGSATPPAIAAAPGTAAGASSETASLGSVHYSYLSPRKPASGDPSAAENAFAEGLRAQRADHLSEAIQDYRRATRLDPADYDANYNLGLALMAQGNVSQALGAYEGTLAIRPESPDARYNFALALKKANYLQDAVNELQKLLSIYPNEPRAHLALGNIYAQQLHQPAKAREHYQKVLETDPHSPQAATIRYWLIDNPP
jgi:Flp pilus assembly protein TadD